MESLMVGIHLLGITAGTAFAEVATACAGLPGIPDVASGQAWQSVLTCADVGLEL